MGAELRDLLTTSAYIPRAAYVQKHRKCKLRACLIGFSRWNAKSQIRSLMCTLRNSNIAITSLVCTLRNSKCAIQMIIQITHFALVSKQSKSAQAELFENQNGIFSNSILELTDKLTIIQTLKVHTSLWL